jgi:hypothetical protein
LLSRQGNTRAYGPDASDPVRLVGQIAAVLSIAAGVIHISAAGDHTSLPVMFAGFMVIAVLQIALGALLLSRPPSRLVIWGAIVMTLGSIGLWLLSRTAGIPYLPDGHVEPVGFKDSICKLFELASIPALLLLLSRDLGRVSVPPKLGGRTLTGLGACCLALMPPALLLGEGTPQSHNHAAALGLHDAHEGLAHAGSPSSHHTHGDSAVQHTHETHGSGSHHSSTTAAVGHDHTVLAGAPLGTAHHHSATQTTGHTHHSDEHTAGGDHHQGEHRDHSSHKHHGGEHGGGHGHGGHEPPEAEPAISVSYEPEPRICVSGTLCIP